MGWRQQGPWGGAAVRRAEATRPGLCLRARTRWSATPGCPARRVTTQDVCPPGAALTDPARRPEAGPPASRWGNRLWWALPGRRGRSWPPCPPSHGLHPRPFLSQRECPWLPKVLVFILKFPSPHRCLGGEAAGMEPLNGERIRPGHCPPQWREGRLRGDLQRLWGRFSVQERRTSVTWPLPQVAAPLAPPQVPLPPTCVGTFPPPPTPPPVGSRHSHSPRHPPEEAGPQEPAPGTKRQGPAGIGCQSQPSLLSRWWTPVLPTLSAWVPAAGTGCELLFPQGVLGGVAKPCHTQLTWDSARWPLAQPGRRFPGAGPVCQPHAGSCDPSSERNQSLGPSRSCPPGEGSGSKEPRYRASVTQGRVL